MITITIDSDKTCEGKTAIAYLLASFLKDKCNQDVIAVYDYGEDLVFERKIKAYNENTPSNFTIRKQIVIIDVQKHKKVPKRVEKLVKKHAFQQTIES